MLLTHSELQLEPGLARWWWPGCHPEQQTGQGPDRSDRWGRLSGTWLRCWVLGRYRMSGRVLRVHACMHCVLMSYTIQSVSGWACT